MIQFNLVIHQMLLNLLAIKCQFWCLNLNQVTYFIVPTMNLLFIKRGSYFYSHIILNYESMNHICMSDSTTKFTKIMIIKEIKFGGLIKYLQRTQMHNHYFFYHKFSTVITFFSNFRDVTFRKASSSVRRP